MRNNEKEEKNETIETENCCLDRNFKFISTCNHKGNDIK